MTGWFAGVALWPLKMLCPEWAITARRIGALGLAVAILAAVALLRTQPDAIDGDNPDRR
jgi:hypothetical protein